jgi:predicted alpha-1,2-mannosidase
MFSTSDHEVVQVKIGTSYISVDQARENLNREIPNWDFDGTQARLKSIWNKKLAAFSVQGGTPDEVVEFYTALYHGMLYPRLFSENGRYYSAFDDKVHQGVSYTGYSLWDIFRAEFSMLTLDCPERVGDMVQALLQDYQEGGWMPKWPNPSYTSIMVATHGDSLVAEAVNKGFKGFDYNLAYQAVYQDGMAPPNDDTSNRWGDRSVGHPFTAREGLTYYKQLGYVPMDKTDRSTSCTLEGAYDDWCVAQVARAAGKDDDYKMFLDRSENYRNVFDPATGWMEGRNSDHSWVLHNDNAFTEGGQRQNSFTVFQDMPGLVKLMGGPGNFIKALDQSAPDLTNEPGEHFPYLYDYAQLPSKAQSMVRNGLFNGYANTPAGLPGNDDCGQISAWWLFGAIGFYPVNPASGVYMIGSPLFDQVDLHLADGKTFTVTASNNSPTNMYIQSAALNGAPLNVPFITWAQIQAGGTLSFDMGPTPSKWAADWTGN